MAAPGIDQLAATLAEAKRIADGLQFACRIPDKVPDFTACGGPAAEAYWDYFTPARISSLLGAVEAALKEHQPVNPGPKDFLADNGDMLTRDEALAIGQLRRLARQWPESLTLLSMAGALCVVRSADYVAGLAQGIDGPGYVLADIDGIPNDGGGC